MFPAWAAQWPSEIGQWYTTATAYVQQLIAGIGWQRSVEWLSSVSMQWKSRPTFTSSEWYIKFLISSTAWMASDTSGDVYSVNLNCEYILFMYVHTFFLFPSSDSIHSFVCRFLNTSMLDSIRPAVMWPIPCITLNYALRTFESSGLGSITAGQQDSECLTNQTLSGVVSTVVWYVTIIGGQ